MNASQRNHWSPPFPSPGCATLSHASRQCSFIPRHRSSTPYHEGAFLSPGVCGPQIRELTPLTLDCLTVWLQSLLCTSSPKQTKNSPLRADMRRRPMLVVWSDLTSACTSHSVMLCHRLCCKMNHVHANSESISLPQVQGTSFHYALAESPVGLHL